MNTVLLLGAGFSRNWDGWLAAEIMGGLFDRLRDNNELSQVLVQAGNFEDALSNVQAQFNADRSERNSALLKQLQLAICATFNEMNLVFANKLTMEFSNVRGNSIVDFLARFDAIFTLNQDLLFELHYNIELAERRRWNGHHFPGMQTPAGWQNAIDYLRRNRLEMVWQPTEYFQIERGLQPIFKLHGSVNWKDRDGSDLLVMGANKAVTIAEKAILTTYANEFARYLQMPDTRLMVIGYGFGDRHINEIITDAWTVSKLRMFIVGPRGRATIVGDDRRKIRTRSALEDIQIIGESMRPLSTTFNGDELELGRLRRFFE